MDVTTMIILLLIGVIGIGVLYFMNAEKKATKEKNKKNNITTPISPETMKLKLQAYERLTILTERIGLSNLITRFNTEGFTARQLQTAIIDAIKTEYEYNISQQIYVTRQIWEAITNLKEQNIFIINQIADTLPENATAMDLSKSILHFLNIDSNASLQPIVLRALNNEAKQLMEQLS
ncbi:MAG TPA: hypothetical protein VFN30_15035 [Chitinophagaceae bacterium]|nr:hypothetical protein [Chitinophagaceae bacterium]